MEPRLWLVLSLVKDKNGNDFISSGFSTASEEDFALGAFVGDMSKRHAVESFSHLTASDITSLIGDFLRDNPALIPNPTPTD